MKFEAWVFVLSGAPDTNFGEVRFRFATDTPMDDPMYPPGWVRALWLDSDEFPLTAQMAIRVARARLATPPTVGSGDSVDSGPDPHGAADPRGAPREEP